MALSLEDGVSHVTVPTPHEFSSTCPIREKHHGTKKDWTKGQQRKEGWEGRKKRAWRKKGKRWGHSVSPNLKQQPINQRAWRCSKAMHGLFLSAKLSGCQFLPPKLLLLAPSFSLSPYLVMSHCIFQYILPTDVWWWWRGRRCERTPSPGLDKWAFRADVERMGMKINLI